MVSAFCLSWEVEECSRTGAPSLHYDHSRHRPITDQEELQLRGFPINRIRDGGERGNTPSLPMTRRAETMASFPPSFWKRDGADHDHTPPLLRRRRADTDHGLLPTFLLEEGWR